MDTGVRIGVAVCGGEDGVGVFVQVGVIDGTTVELGAAVRLGVGDSVIASVRVGVGDGATVRVRVSVGCGVGVDVAAGVLLGECVGVSVRIAVSFADGDGSAVRVDVDEAAAAGVGERVTVGVDDCGGKGGVGVDVELASTTKESVVAAARSPELELFRLTLLPAPNSVCAPDDGGAFQVNSHAASRFASTIFGAEWVSSPPLLRPPWLAAMSRVPELAATLNPAKFCPLDCECTTNRNIATVPATISVGPSKRTVGAVPPL